MANEKRLIDANALLENADVFTIHTKEYGSIEVIPVDAVGDAPTVDAVEVVRCKNCRDCEMGYPEKRLDREATQAWLCKRYKRHVKPDDFCSYGERREGNENPKGA